MKGLTPPRPISEVPAEVLEKWQEMNSQIQERRNKGIYINFPNTIEFKEQSFLAVGNKLMYDNNKYATFEQLILRNLQLTLGEEWWNTESAKPPNEQHYIRRCFVALNNPVLEEQNIKQVSEHVRSMLPTGYQQAVVNLAFDVYVLQHKNSMPEGWVTRLRSYDQYQGVRYEIMVASLFARIGCTLEFYNDHRVRSKHPEFVATHDETGNKVAVEAKSRHRKGVIHSTGEADLRKALLGDITQLFNRALKKDHEDLPYMIFIDVNAPNDASEKTLESRWFSDVRKMIEARGENNAENPEPYNVLCVTNYSPHYEGDKVTKTGGVCLIAIPHAQFPLNDGVQGEFVQRIMQAANGYGYIPRL